MLHEAEQLRMLETPSTRVAMRGLFVSDIFMLLAPI